MRPLLFMVPVVSAIGFVLLTSEQLPPIVASHFDGSGAADGFMPVRAYVRLMLMLLVGLPALAAVLGYWSLGSPRARINIPNQEYWLAPERRTETVRYLRSGMLWFGTFLLAFLCYAHWLVVLANSRQPPVLSNTWFIGGLVTFLAVVVLWLKVFLGRFRPSA